MAVNLCLRKVLDRHLQPYYLGTGVDIGGQSKIKLNRYALEAYFDDDLYQLARQMQKTRLFIWNLTAALSIAAAPVVQAQAKFSFGPRLGVQRTHQTDYNPDHELLFGEITDTPRRYGFQLGVAGNVQFSHVAIQPALVYVQKGYHYKQSGEYHYYDQNYHTHLATRKNLNYWELPLNIVVSTGKEDGLQLIVGGYGALGVEGWHLEKGHIDETPVGEFGYYANAWDREQNAFKDSNGKQTGAHLWAYDFGLNGGLGYKHGSWQVQAIYSRGLCQLAHNMIKDDYSKFTTYNRSVELAVSYFLTSADRQWIKSKLLTK